MDGIKTHIKRVLFISYDGMTDPLGQSQVIPYLKGLTAFGYTFTILSCDKPELYSTRKQYVLDLIEGFPIKWVSLPYHHKPPVLSSVYDYLQVKDMAFKLHLKEHFHLVHTRPGIPTLVALSLKKKFGIKFLNDIRGFWAQERVDGGMWNLKNPLYNRIFRFFKKHEDECLKHADHNVCLTYAAEEIIHSWNHIPGQPVPLEVIPCSVDLDLFNPENIDESTKSEVRSRLGIKPDNIVISYLGSIGGWYMTAEMMQLCKIISDILPKAIFLFISPHRHEVIATVAEANGLSKNKVITVKAGRHEVPLYLSASSFSLFFIKPCSSKLSSSPTKHGEIMAMGIPVITNSGVGDVAEIVKKYNAGYVAEDFTVETFEKIASLLKSGAVFNTRGIIEGAREFYSLENAIEKYRKVYSRIFAD